MLNWSRSAPAALLLFALACGEQRFGVEPPPSSSAVIWSAAGATASGVPGADSTAVYFGTRDHHLIAVDRATGTVRWTATTDARTANTEFGDNVILAAGNVLFGDYVIYAFDAATGARRWVFDPESQGFPGYGAGVHELRTDGATIYAGSASGHVYAINANDGALIWVTPLAADGNSGTFDPVIDAGVLYVVVRHFTNPITGELDALDRSSGRVLWSRNFGPSTVPHTSSGPIPPVAVYDNLVIASVDDGTIHAVDNTTGEDVWVIPRLSGVNAYDDLRPIRIVGSVLVAGSSVPILMGYDAGTGRLLWQDNAGQGSDANTMGTDGSAVYIPFNNGTLGSFEAATGAQNWLRKAPNGAFFDPYPLAGPDAVFAPASSGLIALRK